MIQATEQPAFRYSADPKVPLPIEVVREGPAAIHQAYLRMRDELRSQVERLEGQRADLAEELRDNPVSAANSKGLEGRIAIFDSRITALEREIELVDAAVARTGTFPGIEVRPRENVNVQVGGFPEELIALPVMLILFVLFPITIAYTRRIWRRSGAVAADLPRDIGDRLSRMDQNIDAIALEVERIGENQRYLTRQLGAGAAEPIEVGQREKLEPRR